MNIYRRLDTPVNLSFSKLQSVSKMYPYDTFGYTDLGVETRKFLETEFANVSDDACVVAISQHNGNGRQWGIILIQHPEGNYWRVVAQFGHRSDLLFTRWLTRRRYSMFIKNGSIFVSIDASDYHHCSTFNNPERLGDLRSLQMVA